MKEDFVRIREELNQIGIRRIAADFYLEPKKKGSNFFVKSPVTHDKTWSLALYTGSNRFVDFANGNLSGDCIAFLAYVKNLNQWQALKELQSYYGLSNQREQDKQEARRRIQLQQERERKRAERQQAFKAALFGEIDRLRQWEDICRFAIEKRLYEPFSDLWCYFMDESERTSRKLDILCASDVSTYRRMKRTGADSLPTDRYQWLIDVLGVLKEQAAFNATMEELTEIKAQRDFELTRKPGAERRCGVEW